MNSLKCGFVGLLQCAMQSYFPLLIQATVVAQALVLRQKLLHNSWMPDPNELLVGSPALELT